jgi:hypothetical protein
VTTVLQRLMLAGIAEHVALRHIRYHRVRVDGVPIASPDHPAPHPTHVVIHGLGVELD